MAASNTKRKSKATPVPADNGAQYAASVGRTLRLARAKRGLTRRQLASQSGISERYLAQIESGQGNPSIVVLKSIADAMDIAVSALLPAANEGGAQSLYDIIRFLPAPEIPRVAALLERHLADAGRVSRARRISLVGLRGAGKSTLGRMLAEHLGVPFIELNRVIEQEYGATVPMLIEMSGAATFRRYERKCLEQVIAKHDGAVIATAGGMVANPETYGFLLQHTHAIWLTASPEEHMTRVMAQGDFRPMAENREAMADLVAILESRRADYGRARAQLDTARRTKDQSFAKLRRLVQPFLRASET